MAKPIVLIGFPSCGKTTLGKAFAFGLHKEFYDLDEYVVQSNGFSDVSEFVRAKGFDEYREAEKVGLKELLRMPDIVIACGGGAPCNEESIRLIKEYGFSMYLDEDKKELWQRLCASKESRPLIAGKSDGAIRQWLNRIWHKRLKYYSQADVYISSYQFRKMIEKRFSLQI